MSEIKLMPSHLLYTLQADLGSYSVEGVRAALALAQAALELDDHRAVAWSGTNDPEAIASFKQFEEKRNRYQQALGALRVFKQIGQA